MENEVLISVIVPVYNVEKYVGKCFESLISQTLKNIEIICINDGSTDGSLKILEDYVQKDKRILVINQENQGVGASRNKGIKIARGKYVCFIDSDDFYPEPDILQTLHEKAESNNSLITGGEFCDYENGRLTQNYKESFSGYIFEKEGFIDYKDYQFDYGYHRFLYNKDFLTDNDIFFPELTRFQDVPFFVNAMIKAEKFYALKKITYAYRISDLNKHLSSKKASDVITGFNIILKYAQHNNLNDLYRLTVTRLFKEYLTCFLPNISLSLKLYKTYTLICDSGIEINDINLKKIIKKFFLHSLFSIKNYNGFKTLFLFGKPLYLSQIKYPKLKQINKKQLSKQITSCNEGISAPKRTHPVIVSLTSFPQRMKDIHFCLYSLLNQSFKPDKIILWLSQEEFPDKEQDIPQTVLSLKEKGLEIKWCKNNLKSYKKLIPTLNECNDCIIVTADDDIFYPPNWLETLYCSYVKNPEYIHCHRAHKILFDINDNILPYNMWEHETDNKNESFNTFFTGAGGVLYPPDSLYKNILNEELFTQLAPNADDIWFWAMAVLNNTKIKVVENNIKCLTYINPERELGLTNEYNLHSQNCDEGMNDKQLANVFKHYPKILEKLHNE